MSARRMRDGLGFAVLLALALCGTTQFIATNKAYLAAVPGEIGERHVYHGLAWSPWRTLRCDWPAGAADDVCTNPRVDYDFASWSSLLFVVALASILLLPAARRRAREDRVSEPTR